MVHFIKDKVIIVIGAPCGLGRATCLALAAEGAHVAVHYFDRQDTATALCDQLGQDFGVRAVPCYADIGAALDVFEQEPPGLDHPLVGLENVTLTFYMAGGSVDAFVNSPQRLAVDMADLFDQREEVRYLLNRESLRELIPRSVLSGSPPASAGR